MPNHQTQPDSCRRGMVGKPSTKSSLRAASNNGSAGNKSQIFIVGSCWLHRKNAKLQGLVSHRDGLVTPQVFPSGASVEKRRVAKGDECSKGEGDVWCLAGGPMKGMAPLTDFVYVGMRVSV